MSFVSGVASPKLARQRLGDGFVHDFANRVESGLGVDVVVLPLSGAGYSLRLKDYDVIVLGATDRWFRSNFTLAHELGHLVNEHAPVDEGAAAQRAENKANTFAAELLMPAAYMRTQDWAVPPTVIAQRIWELGVSTQALRTRLRYLGLEVSENVESYLELTTPRLIEKYLLPTVATAEEVTEQMALTARRRFPLRLLNDLRSAVDSGRAPRASLSWALGSRVEDEDSPDDQTDSLGDDLRVDLLDGLV